MAEFKTKIETIFPIAAWRIFSLIGLLPLLFSGFMAFAGDLSPDSIISFTNEERTKRNLPALQENKDLSLAAQRKAEDMLKNNYFSHTSPTGVTPWHWIKETGYEYQFAGENLAINFNSASEQGKAWMNSKTHRENILNNQYTEVGVAVVSGKIKGKTSFVTVQIFGTPAVPVAIKDSKNSESIFSTIPTVKGVQTQTIEASVVQSANELGVYIKTAYQKAKAAFIQNQEIIFRTAGEVSLALLLISLTAPGIIFVSLSFRELFPKSGHITTA